MVSVKRYGLSTYLYFGILFQVANVGSKIIEGHLWTGINWSFLARFCFLSLHGKFEYEIQYDMSYAVQNIDLYYDTNYQWNRVYGNTKDLDTCREKESVLQVEDNQFINLTTKMVVSGCHQVTNSNKSSVSMHCKGTRNFKTVRERWWFVAISNCNSTKGLRLSYRFLMTNGEKDDLLHHHFSADEFYLLPVLVVSLIQNIIVGFFAIWSTVILKARQLLHTSFKMYIISMLFHTFGVFFLVVHYTSFGVNGKGVPKIKFMGQIFESTGKTIFLILLILLAKGYTVTRARLRQGSTLKLILFEILLRSWSSSLYLRISCRLWNSLSSNCGVDNVYVLNLFHIEALSRKGIVLLSLFLVGERKGCRVVSVEHFVVLIGQIFFLLITRPSINNRNFPYHVRTSQIGIMEAITGNTLLGHHTLDNFSHGGNYNVSSQNMEVFTVSNNKETLNGALQSSRSHSNWANRDNEDSTPPRTPPPTYSNGQIVQNKSIFNPNDEL
ncbi:unnamed protein product [Lepeophtheirus salmonis]|uniref:(salmon louse) hypothetical protein n=1 Tax=Lepeophtheirus salmonis TaxID=72036 RepID=A0A7R8H6Z4_LEPSM|nr:unnamed protein product [Lepeophtheirus salmonis]CAF2913165.1 unnamed protein product [Lepeophtheirus salmonis]